MKGVGVGVADSSNSIHNYILKWFPPVSTVGVGRFLNDLGLLDTSRFDTGPTAPLFFLTSGLPSCLNMMPWRNRT